MKTVLWIGEANPSQLAYVLCPRGGDWLQAELEEARGQGIDILVSLLTPQDNEELGLTGEARIAQQLGMRFVSYPILDRCTPSDPVGYRRLVEDLRNQTRAGHRIGAHCRGCIGRATVLLASIMIALGWQAAGALRVIEQARGFQVPDTQEQLEWILNFRPEP
ncbi:MAG: tyrosine protein phosphatase [Acidobacteriota bacterium]